MSPPARPVLRGRRRSLSHQEMLDAGYEALGPYVRHKFRKVLAQR
jgi:hypothetical protein